MAEDGAEKAIYTFYDALEDLLRGRGTERMRESWHHEEYVTTGHPFGHWARGWAEVWATWQETAEVFGLYRGHDKRTDRLGAIHDLHVVVAGDAAYGTGVFKATYFMSDGELPLRVNCTNVAQRLNGVWKMVHHHADQAPPALQEAIGKMVQAGTS